MRALYSPSSPALAAVVGPVLLVLLGLVGCSDEDGGTGGAPADGNAPAPTDVAAPAPDEVPPTGDGGDSAGEDADNRVTPPGTALTVGERAIVPYRSPDGRVEALLAVSVVRLGEGDPTDLDRVDIGDRAAGAVPYYVTLSIKKVSGDKLAGLSLEPGFTLRLIDGSEALPIVPYEPFEPCRWVEAPDRIDRAGTFRTCDPYTIPEQAEVGAYAFVGQVGGSYAKEPIVWTEPVEKK